jgi:hypothetical protein
MSRRTTWVLGCALAVLLAACGGGASNALVEPASVATDMVPATLGEGLTIHEFGPARARFASAGASSLVADRRVWVIRRGQTLVGTLQVSTVKPDVSVVDKDDRKAIIGGVMTGISYETVQVGDTPVIASTAADKSLYLWFGPGLFEVLQVKSTKVAPDEIAAELIEFQQATGKIGGPAR